MALLTFFLVASKSVAADASPVDIAIELALYVMRTQIFNDGNKRTAIIFANHYLVAHGAGLMVVPESIVPEFKQLLAQYYEGTDDTIAVLAYIRAYISCRANAKRRAYPYCDNIASATARMLWDRTNEDGRKAPS